MRRHYHYPAPLRRPAEPATNFLPRHPTVYLCYLFFQLFSHKSLYDDSSAEVFQSTRYEKKHKVDAGQGAVAAGLGLGSFTVHSLPTTADLERTPETMPEPEEVEEPSMSVPMTVGLLVVVTVVCPVVYPRSPLVRLGY